MKTANPEAIILEPTAELIAMVREQTEKLTDSERKVFVEQLVGETNVKLGWRIFDEWRGGLDKVEEKRVMAWLSEVSPRWRG